MGPRRLEIAERTLGGVQDKVRAGKQCSPGAEGRSREQSSQNGLKFRVSAQNPAPIVQRSLVGTLSRQEAVDQSKTQATCAL